MGSFLGLNDTYHDSSFCIYADGIAEHFETERFSRLKYDGLNPLLAVPTILGKRAFYVIENIEYLAVLSGDFVAPFFEGLKDRLQLDHRTSSEIAGELLERATANNNWSDPDYPFDRTYFERTSLHHDWLSILIERCRLGQIHIDIVGHHVAHAANAFYSSPFEKSLILTLDGGGYDFANTSQTERIVSYGGVFIGDGNDLKTLKFVTEFSIGGAWSRISRHVFGMKFGEEGTVMAMAAFGEPTSFERVVQNSLLWATEEVIRDETNARILDGLYSEMRGMLKTEQDRFNLAAALQLTTEYKIYNFVQENLVPDIDTVCLAGGSFLNCQITGKLYDWFPGVRSFFLPPAPYDGGLSMGVVQYVAHVIHKQKVWGRELVAFPYAMGRTYSKFEILAACRSARFVAISCDHQEVIERLAAGQIGALFGGSAESGRRALGNRSIIADPRSPSMKEYINSSVKHRAAFRPFAPMILAERISDWFECSAQFQSPYMSHALRIRPEKASEVPAILHEDKTARVQTVHTELNEHVHELLRLWEHYSGLPILLNTSFNDREPIVQTPAEALNCFREVPIDFLYFYDHGLLCSR